MSEEELDIEETETVEDNEEFDKFDKFDNDKESEEEEETEEEEKPKEETKVSNDFRNKYEEAIDENIKLKDKRIADLEQAAVKPKEPAKPLLELRQYTVPNDLSTMTREQLIKMMKDVQHNSTADIANQSFPAIAKLAQAVDGIMAKINKLELRISAGGGETSPAIIKCIEENNLQNTKNPVKTAKAMLGITKLKKSKTSEYGGGFQRSGRQKRPVKKKDTDKMSDQEYSDSIIDGILNKK